MLECISPFAEYSSVITDQHIAHQRAADIWREHNIISTESPLWFYV